MKLSFVTETVAYDVGAIVQSAHELGVAEEGPLLDSFLELDRASPERGQEQALKGVRKAQVKLAAYYLMVGEEVRARRIRDDMAAEPRSRLAAIRDELVRVETKDFWEIIDRGRNFEFMPPKQKEAMRVFFSWFDPLGGASIPPAASTPKVPPSASADSGGSGPVTSPAGGAPKA